MRPLTVCKASAGSGKTFRLTVEYIKLLIENPGRYRNILAVTFTNKATEEMKTRILSQLYGLWKMLPDSQSYMDEITKALDTGEKQVSLRAGMALGSLVHNYSYFRVETIDSFFQSVLRNLSRELGLTANLRIGLNDYQVEEQAVDRLIEQLDTTSAELQWLIVYIFSNIDENKSWNVIGQIKKFGCTIFKDFYKEASKELNEVLATPDFFRKYTDEIYKTREYAKKKIASYADQFDHITAVSGLTVASFKRGRNGIPSYFNKLRGKDFSEKKCCNDTFKACLEGVDNWVSKSNKDGEAIKSVVRDKLLPLLQQAESERNRMWRLYLTADVTMRHLNKLRLLNSIERNVRELNDETNTFLLSDTQSLLQTMIKGTDTPFIFEKIGCQLEHIMIDEFQDTSSVQWKNFKVLLEDCMSHAGSHTGNTINNLIVGDVKQSIYRWRDGDWRLLNGITSQFKSPEQSVYIDEKGQTNYRSEWNIVEFNNNFFATAAKSEYTKELEVNTEETAEEIKEAYHDVEQSKRSDREKDRRGLADIKLFPDDDYEEKTLIEIESSIDRLLCLGVSQSDIAILIRTKRHIPIIADYFMAKRPDINIVSDEAFRLDASLAVNTIIQALTMLLHPEDKMAKASLALIYQKRILHNDIAESDIINSENVMGVGMDGLLPAKFMQNIDMLVKMPLMDTTEFIMSAFKLNTIESESAYICAFFDEIADFMSTNTGNLNTFMAAWNETISQKTIQTDATDGIRIITIHKSKGLEFDNVIIPFCDWILENNDNTLWCRPEEAPFNKLPLVPVNYNKNLRDTIYADDYCNEHIQNTVDNLNLLYVAFTRAGKNLFVMGRREKQRSTTRSELLLDCITKLAETLEGTTLEGEDDEKATLAFSYGSLAIRTKKGKTSNNVFMQTSNPVTVTVNTATTPVSFRQSNKSREFTSLLSDDDDDTKKQTMYIKTGNILHKIFSTIRTTNDIDNALRQLETEGIIYDDVTTADNIRKMLSERLKDERIKEWFSPCWHVFNECNILSVAPSNGKVIERRPDRVITNGEVMKVIDFKFGKPQPEYRQQVCQYIELLKKMGYQHVSGFLWYVYSNKIDEVKLEDAQD